MLQRELQVTTREAKMKLSLQLMKNGSCDVTIGDIRHIVGVLERDGYQVEVRPTEIQPQVIIITK